jgi:long-chain acyl-CoA synthetase
MRGYHRDTAATALAIDAEGWLHTGDLGQLDPDGCLVITGRIKELFKTSGGKYVAPVPIEQAVAAACPLIDQVLVVAEGRQCVSCLIFPDLEAIHAARDRLGTATATDADLLNSPALHAELARAVEQANEKLDQWERIRFWRLAPVAPSIERGEMTPTHKLRRHVLCQTWHHLIDEMYAEKT